MMRNWLAAAVLGIPLFTAAAAQAAVTPYFNDFSGDVSEFVETPAASWTPNAAAGVYNNTITAGDTPASLLIPITDLGGPAATAKDFQVSTTFRINSIVGTQTTVGIAALAGDNNATDANNPYYLADVQQLGRLRLFQIASSNTSFREVTFPGAQLLPDVDYTLKLDGTYTDAGAIDLVLTLVTPTGAFSISATDTTPLEGTFFGLRDRTTGATGRLNVDFTDFAVVPEPATLGLLLPLGALCLARRRRR
jgi:hypothetical protein